MVIKDIQEVHKGVLLKSAESVYQELFNPFNRGGGGNTAFLPNEFSITESFFAKKAILYHSANGALSGRGGVGEYLRQPLLKITE